jgi:hypothetical protein
MSSTIATGSSMSPTVTKPESGNLFDKAFERIAQFAKGQGGQDAKPSPSKPAMASGNNSPLEQMRQMRAPLRAPGGM